MTPDFWFIVLYQIQADVSPNSIRDRLTRPHLRWHKRDSRITDGENMLVTRWQAPMVPTKQQIKMMFEAEGLSPFEEVFPPDASITDHRHPFDEVRMVAEGQMLLDIAGNRLLLRAGDKIVIPSNTRHSKKVDGTTPCVCICALKTS